MITTLFEDCELNMLTINIAKTSIPSGVIENKNTINPILYMIYDITCISEKRKIFIIQDDEYSILIFAKKNKCILFNTKNILIDMKNKHIMSFYDIEYSRITPIIELDIRALKSKKIQEIAYLYYKLRSRASYTLLSEICSMSLIGNGDTK